MANNDKQTIADLLARLTADAYSAPAFAEGEWVKAARLLLDLGASAAEAECVLRSKWTRWCRDMSGDDWGKATAASLRRFLETGSRRDGAKRSKAAILKDIRDLHAEA